MHKEAPSTINQLASTLDASQHRIDALEEGIQMPRPENVVSVDSKNDWTERLDIALTNIMNTVSDLRGKHNITANLYEARSNVLGVGLIVMSTTVSLFLVLPPDSFNIIPILAKVFSFTVSGLTVLNQFFKFAEKSLQHKTISKKYVSLYNNIYSQMVIGDYFKRSPGTQFISWVLKTYNSIVAESPSIPSNVSRSWKKQKAKLKEQEALNEYTFDPNLFRDIAIPMSLLNPTRQPEAMISENTDLELGNLPPPKGSKLLDYNLNVLSNSD